jgi:hypothetical protein
MNELERRIRQLLNRLSSGFSNWWSSSAARRSQLRHQATERATTALNDLRDTDAGKRAASTLHDLRDTDAAKRAATALHDLRDSEAGKRAASTLTDLRQRESVRKAEESAKRALHDLRSGGHGSDGNAAS